MRTFKTRARNGALVVLVPGLVPLGETDRWGPEKAQLPAGFISNPRTRSFWMIPKLSSIVIVNLIANLSFLYHKPEKHAVIRID